MASYFVDRTCGEACWQAREDICRCSCGGRNHACLRGQERRPERTRKLNGWLYQLIAVEIPGASCIAVGERPLEDQKRAIVQGAVDAGKWSWHGWESNPGYPAKLKTASQSEIERWPELAGHREGPWRPATLWVRCDLVTS